MDPTLKPILQTAVPESRFGNPLGNFCNDMRDHHNDIGAGYGGMNTKSVSVLDLCSHLMCELIVLSMISVYMLDVPTHRKL
jgi:hypothetical protein